MTQSSERHGIQSVIVGSTLLRVLAQKNGPMSLSSLAKASDMVPAKAHRYLAGFITARLITQDPVSGQYDLGPLALDVGLAAIRRLDVVDLALPVMTALRDDTGETTSLSVWGNSGPTLVRWVANNAPVSISVNVGSVLPVLTSSNGRIFAAYLPAEIIEPFIRRELRSCHEKLERVGLGDRGQVEILLEQVRGRGYSEGIGLVVPAIASMSCPVFDRNGAVVAALTIVGITGMIDTTPDSPMITALKAAAAAVSERMGFRSPTGADVVARSPGLSVRSEKSESPDARDAREPAPGVAQARRRVKGASSVRRSALPTK